MSKSLDDHLSEFEASPKRKIRRGICCVLGIVLVLGIAGYLFGWIGETGRVIQEEFGPEAAIEKYEWFIDASNQLDKKLADIDVFTENMESLKKSYGSTPRADWDRVDKQQLNQWNMEIAGIKASYNSLAAEYNAASEKFNWKVFKDENPQYKGIPETYLEK